MDRRAVPFGTSQPLSAPIAYEGADLSGAPGPLLGELNLGALATAGDALVALTAATTLNVE